MQNNQPPIPNGHCKPEDNSTNISKLIIEIQEICLSSSLSFDMNYNSTFLEFLKQNSRKIIEKFSTSFKVSSKLQGIISKKSFFKTRKDTFVKKTLENVILPPKSKIFITVSQNLRIEEIKKINQVVGPSSLDVPYPQAIIDYLKQSEPTIENQIPMEKILKLFFIIRQIQAQLGFSNFPMQISAFILKKDENFFKGLWTKIMQESKINKMKEIEEDYINNNKLYAQKYANFFCSICMVYGCFHFIKVTAQEEQNKYKTVFYLPENVNTNIEIKWYQNFRCFSSTDCCRGLKKNKKFNGDFQNMELKKFRKFERKLIEFCKDYNMMNPCFIYLLLKNGSSNKTCVDIKIYIEKTFFSKQNDQIEQEKPHGILEPIKFKHVRKGRAKCVEYIPCFHEGFYFIFF